MTGSHHRAKEPKSLPAQHKGITDINYGGSNSSYNTIYIPCPSMQRLDPEAPPFPNSFFTSLILLTALFPAASCLQDNSKHRERGESKQDQRDRGEESAGKDSFSISTSMGACSRTAHFLYCGNLRTVGCLKQWSLMR